MHFREVVKLRNHALNIYTEINLRLLKNKTKKPRATAARIFERGELPTPASVDSPRNFLGGLLRSPASGCTTQRSSTSLQGQQGSVLRQDTSEKMKPEAPTESKHPGPLLGETGTAELSRRALFAGGFPGQEPGPRLAAHVCFCLGHLTLPPLVAPLPRPLHDGLGHGRR